MAKSQLSRAAVWISLSKTILRKNIKRLHTAQQPLNFFKILKALRHMFVIKQSTKAKE